MLLKKNHTVNSAKHAPFQKERFAAGCSEVGAARFVSFDPTDGLDSKKLSLEKVFVNLSNRRLQNTEQINNTKKRLRVLTFLGLIL